MKLATRTTKSGTVEGRCEGGVCRFFGVPYAAPPVDDLRFEPPQPVQPWEGTRDARNPGPCAPHKIAAFPAIDIVSLVGEGGSSGGDYLTLNIWTPEAAVNRPVMVFIHGGGFVIGSKADEARRLMGAHSTNRSACSCATEPRPQLPSTEGQAYRGKSR